MSILCRNGGASLAAAALVTAALAWLPPCGATDLLDRPALAATRAVHALGLGITSAGRRLVTAGERGTVLYSDDGGRNWSQAAVPVSVTLTALCFPGAAEGWAVGHDGVILHSADGGASWALQFDGNRANALVLEAARRRLASAQGGAPDELRRARSALDDATAGARFGPSRPLFDVWFDDARSGYAIGSFGQLFHTADGGRNWSSLGELLDNPESLHLNAITRTPWGSYLIAGEGGRVYLSDAPDTTWKLSETGYQGQLYGAAGLVDSGGVRTLLAFGFGGHVFRSADAGGHWQAVPLPTQKAVVAALRLPGWSIALLTADDGLYASRDGAISFERLGAGDERTVAAAVLLGADRLATTGPGGVALRSLQQEAASR